MDAEPVSCRRTDGRKWRCRLPVLPDQKYCERHVNRGRFRSRKPVEEVQTTLLNSKSKSTGTKSIPLLKTALNLQSHAKIKHNKASIKNQSLKIKKHSMEDTFSAKSVVQDGNDVDGGVSSNGHESTQSERCRRTDGRKWQCKKDVLPGMKYCVQHMHRGVKKAAKLNPCLSFIVGVNGNQPNDSRSSSETTTISM